MNMKKTCTLFLRFIVTRVIEINAYFKRNPREKILVKYSLIFVKKDLQTQDNNHNEIIIFC